MKRLGTLMAVVAGLALSTSALAGEVKADRLWKAKCSSCHGMDGKADTAKGKKMAMASLASADFKKKSDADIKKAINEGVSKEDKGVKKEMDPYKDELKAEEIDALVAFIKALP